MATNFYDAFVNGVDTKDIASKGGLSYLAAAKSMALAGRPQVTFVDFGDKPHLECLNGALVAVDLPVAEGLAQRIWLPVLDQETNSPISLSKVTVNDINSSRQRCLVKAIASVYGWGMSLYLGCDGDGAKAAGLLKVKPDTALDEAEPVVALIKEGGAPYIEWGVGVTVCRITDPTFVWNVVEHDGLPYRNVLGGLMVDVDTVYRGKVQRLSLPMMDGAFNPIPADKATVFDWNKTVMRCLTKCIAFNTGYGIGVYAEEFGTADDNKGKAKRGAGKKDAQAAEAAKAAAPAAAAPAPAVEPEKAPEKAPAPTVTEPAAEPAAEAVAQAPEDAAQAPVEAAPVEAAAEAAPAQPEAAPAVEAPAPAAQAPAPERDCIGRFRNVMKQRHEIGGVVGLISLFDALKNSVKFTAEEKPSCFAFLIPAVTARVTVAEIGDAVAALTAHQAMQYLAADSRDMVAAKLTATMLAAGVAAGDDALRDVPAKLIAAGVVADEADLMRLAAMGNVPAETLDLLEAVMDTASA